VTLIGRFWVTPEVKESLLEYTQTFTKTFIRKGLRKRFLIKKVRFNYETETWEARQFLLPKFENDFVILTPKNLLTRDDTWINRHDLISDFDRMQEALPNEQLRAQVNNYFLKMLPRDATPRERNAARMSTIHEFPVLVDAYIRYKEDNGREAVATSASKVRLSEQIYLEQFGALSGMLDRYSAFYKIGGLTYREAQRRVGFLKDVIENKGGHKVFYVQGKPIQREADVHILYRLTWFATSSDVSREVNDGRGPADFKISRGARDKTLVEFKLASNPNLEKNLAHQTKVYEKASDAKRAIKVILYFSKAEYEHVAAVLERLKLEKDQSIILIDARSDNKPSGSKARAA